ncbi:hypothetical protein P7H22_21220 [Paenibacillus larvae]|nr:hypothetical protein [Paenibacillus larvae]
MPSEFKKAIDSFWSAKHSQIYVELKNLLNDDLITQYIEMSGAKLRKRCTNLLKKERWS